MRYLDRSGRELPVDGPLVDALAAVAPRRGTWELGYRVDLDGPRGVLLQNLPSRRGSPRHDLAIARAFLRAPFWRALLASRRHPASHRGDVLLVSRGRPGERRRIVRDPVALATRRSRLRASWWGHREVCFWAPGERLMPNFGRAGCERLGAGFMIRVSSLGRWPGGHVGASLVAEDGRPLTGRHLGGARRVGDRLKVWLPAEHPDARGVTIRWLTDLPSRAEPLIPH